ncbi:hypothetical protein ISU10_14845 [Nocardioides agariphilus]|jgi:hypothetical protein|uniref:Uncharacterized protein n=1 Tax=Nocardioides agariphilus TaxID=433664 RepID=A0A930VQW1_9ACTN|nr:hypothetical protein [Nocardioides agariphilus]MBF4769042.1 hypothetical protein [Nocardioides agariphilus]
MADLESNIESRLHEALGAEGDHTEPAPDLFSRVVGSIADDRRRRTRVHRLVLAWAAGLALAVALTVMLTPRDEEGLHMPWWILEIATTAALVAIAIWLGPFIKRFGRAYAADVFHDNPLTGKSYIVLTDVVYYLIFTAYILFTVRVEAPDFSGDVTAGMVRSELVRIGGILLIIGVLHGLNIVIMPVLGRLFSLNRRLPPRWERDPG